MQPHEGPRNPQGKDKRPPPRSQTWWLVALIVALVGMIAVQLAKRWT
jgi:hypothetical protein